MLLRKYFTFILVFLLMFFLVDCKKEVSVNKETSSGNIVKEDLPSIAMSFINNYYPDIPVKKYEVKDVLSFGKTFEVELKNGVEVNFDEKGNWKEIKDSLGVDKSLLPENVFIYVEKNNAETKVTKIETDKKEIKVELSSGLDLLFDADGNFIR